MWIWLHTYRRATAMRTEAMKIQVEYPILPDALSCCLTVCLSTSTACMGQILSAVLSFALLARGLSRISASPGTTGFFVMTLSFGFPPHAQTGKSGGQRQPFSAARKAFLTLLSSSEGKE